MNINKLKDMDRQNKSAVKLNESQLRKIVAESVKKVLKEDRQRLPFASVIDYANEEMPFGFHLEYNDKSKRIALKQDNVGFMDISNNGFLSGYFESLSEAFKVIEKYTMNGTGYEHVIAGAIGDWKGNMSLSTEGGFYDVYAQFEGLVDNGDNRWSENPYDNTEYYENMKKPDWYDAYTIKNDSKIDNRKAARSLQYHMDRADNEQLHSMDSMNRDLMDTDMIRKIKGAKR